MIRKKDRQNRIQNVSKDEKKYEKLKQNNPFSSQLFKTKIIREEKINNFTKIYTVVSRLLQNSLKIFITSLSNLKENKNDAETIKSQNFPVFSWLSANLRRSDESSRQIEPRPKRRKSSASEKETQSKIK
jgi:lantibiotic modifying enzyme